MAGCGQYGGENHSEFRGTGAAFRWDRSDSDAAPKVVSQTSGGRTNRVTEDRINTEHYAHLSTRKYVI